MIVRWLFAGFLFGLPSVAPAQNMPSGMLRPTGVMIEGDRVYLDAENGTNPHGCQIGNRYSFPVDPARREMLLSMAMTAVMSKAKVHAWLHGCTSSNWGTVPELYLLYLHGE